MKAIERNTLTAADHITVVNNSYREKIRKRLSGMSPEITIIPNGYDKQNFVHTTPGGDENVFSILYSGLFYGARKPDWFLHAVKKVGSRNHEFNEKVQIQFQGGLIQQHWKTINQLGLSDKVMDFGYLKHQDAVQNIVKADLLFLTLGNRKHISAVTPGKVFEYMGSLKPILAFIPNGVTQSLLDEYGAAISVGIKDIDAGADAIEEFFEKWKIGELPKGNPEFVKQFERSQTTKALSNILEKIAEEKNDGNR